MLSRLLTFLCVLFLSQVSLAQQSGTLAPETVPESCPVTKPSDQPFVARRLILHRRRRAALVWYGRLVDFTVDRPEMANGTKNILVAERVGAI